MNLPERDKYSETKTEMKAKLAMIFGGRVAEELIFGKENITSVPLMTSFKLHKELELWSWSGG